MYNPLLVTFLAVADCGSFTKAAEKLFISPTAVMKQMNALENHTKLKLTERTPAGIRITKAGAVIYRDTKFIMDYSDKSVAAARAALRMFTMKITLIFYQNLLMLLYAILANAVSHHQAIRSIMTPKMLLSRVQILS